MSNAMKNSVVASGVVLLMAAALQACCFRTGDGGNEDAAPASGATPVAALEIVSWGPHQTRAGVPFNVQPGGHAAIWIQVDQPLDGRIALIQFDDAFLEGQVSGHMVSAVVPEPSYARPGAYEIRVIARSGDAEWSSNKVSFTVE